MAVAFDAESESHTGTTPSTSEASYTWNHAGHASLVKGVLVYCFTNAFSGNAVDTGVTYGGVAMTSVGNASDTTTEPGHTQAWFLGSAIPQGTQAVVVTRTNNTVQSYSVCFTVTAGADTETFGLGVIQDDNVLGEVAVNDGSPGTNSLRFYGLKSGLAAPPAAGANTTAGPSLDPGAQISASYRETTPGQGSRNVGPAVSTSDDTAAVYLAIREVTGAAAVGPPFRRRPQSTVMMNFDPWRNGGWS